MVDAVSPLSLAPGATFAERYQIVRCIAAGGMGAVYEAIHLDTQRRRALKVMLPQLVKNDQLRRRFKQEATVVSQVHSQHIVEITDAGVDVETGAPFIVMELLFGHDLQELLETKGPMNPHQLAEVVRQAALALDRTHAAGIVHRDLKPENLFVTRRDDGTPHVKVLDFGIAKVVADGVKSTNQTATIGTPMYMAPEQIQAKEEIGGATDTYALAQVAYTMLVGEPYFEEESAESTNTFQLIMSVANGVGESAMARAKRRKGYAVSDAVNAWFMRATDREPARRYASPGELAEAFKKAIGGTGDFRMSIPDAGTTDPATAAEHVGPDSADLATSEFLASHGAELGTAKTVPEPSNATPPITEVAAPDELPTAARAPTTSAAIAAPTVQQRSGSGAMLAVVATVIVVGGGLSLWRTVLSGGGDAQASDDRVEETSDTSAADADPSASSSAVARAPRCPSDMIRIPRGIFRMGGGDEDAAPVHELKIGPYCMDKTEVTVSAFAACVEAGECEAQTTIQWTGAGPKDHERFDASCNFGRDGRADHPINCLDWTQANNYCAHAGKRLPTEPEWELAARGTENRILTWGKAPLSPELLNACGQECKDRFGKGRTWNMMYSEADPHPDTAPALSFVAAAGPYGLLNMAGNVMEWTADWFVRYEGATSVEEDPVSPPKPLDNPTKVARGGSFLSYATDQVTTFHRTSYPVTFRNVTTGVRCAKNLSK